MINQFIERILIVIHRLSLEFGFDTPESKCISTKSLKLHVFFVDKDRFYLVFSKV